MGTPRVVVGVDGSALSLAAVSQAAQLASSRAMTLHVLHALAPDLPMLGFDHRSDRSVVVEHGQRLVADGAACAHAVDPELTVTTSCHDGYASEALVAASRTAALVALGAVGQGVFGLAGVGAVTMQVVTHARCPVLVVGHEPPPLPESERRVVAGVDGSPESLRAVATAFDEAALRGASLDVVHGWRARGSAVPPASTDGAWEEWVASVESAVDEALASRRAGAPDVEVEFAAVRTDPVPALTERTEGAVLLVVGSRGSGGFPGLHVGSVALGLIARSRCPMLVSR